MSNPKLGTVVKLLPQSDNNPYENPEDFKIVQNHLWLMVYIVPGDRISWTSDRWVMVPINREGAALFDKTREFHSGNRAPWNHNKFVNTDVVINFEKQIKTLK
jgi:hypothetical protein